MFLVSFILFQNAFAQRRTERILNDGAKRITKDNFPFTSETPKGVQVFSVNKPNSKMLDAIDRGLADYLP